MRTYKVTTPAKDFTGEVGGVHFIHGSATVEAPAPLPPIPYSDEATFTRAQLAAREEIGQHPGYRAMAYFRQAGYVVEDVTPEPKRRRAAATDEAKTEVKTGATDGDDEQGGTP